MASKAIADKAVADLEVEKAACQQHVARVSEVEDELKDAIRSCEALELKDSEQASELASAVKAAQDVRSESRSACEEIKKAREIASGKTFLLQSIFGGRKYLGLTGLWSFPGVFVDLLRSSADAAQYFRAQEGNNIEKLFWS